MKNMIKACAPLVVALPLLAHAADGAEAAKHFQERNKAFFAQQAKDRTVREIRELQAKKAETSKETTQNIDTASNQGAGRIAE